MKRPNIVVVGGGTGLSVLLSGLKVFPVNITAVVAVTDDGGSTGKLREIYNVPAVGDIRKVLTSLSNSEEIFERVLEYRLDEIDDHAIGNLILTALIETTGDLSKATKSLSKILNINGQVFPAINENATLEGVTINGEIISGETNIDASESKIEYIRYDVNPTVPSEVIDAYLEADLIIFSMGSLFTSIIPNIIPEDARNAILNSNAKKLYVCNAMSSKETEGFNLSAYIEMLNRHMGQKFLDAVVVNDKDIPDYIKELYIKENSHPVSFNESELKEIKVIKDDLVVFENNVVRHKPYKLSALIYAYIISRMEI